MVFFGVRQPPRSRGQKVGSKVSPTHHALRMVFITSHTPDTPCMPYISLHWGGLRAQCRHIFHTWSVWDTALCRTRGGCCEFIHFSRGWMLSSPGDEFCGQGTTEDKPSLKFTAPASFFLSIMSRSCSKGIVAGVSQVYIYRLG